MQLDVVWVQIVNTVAQVTILFAFVAAVREARAHRLNAKKLELENAKLSLEVERMRREAAQHERRIVPATLGDITKYGQPRDRGVQDEPGTYSFSLPPLESEEGIVTIVTDIKIVRARRRYWMSLLMAFALLMALVVALRSVWDVFQVLSETLPKP